MPYTVNQVVKMIITIRQDDDTQLYKNILHYRVTAGTMLDDQAEDYIESAILPFFSRFRSMMMLTCRFATISLTNLTDTNTPVHVRNLPDVGARGSLISNDDDVPQASACITRKSFKRGRQGIGRLFFGPLSAAFIYRGLIVPDPVIQGDLQPVLDNLGDPITFAEGDLSWQPIICKADGTGVDANSAVRTQSIAAKAVYLKSRRPGIGE